MKRLCMIFAAMSIAVTPADAATLSMAEGDVLVNAGNGFTRATAGQELRAGDRVMVGARGGTAAIAYDQACIEQVQKGHVTTVKASVPCAAESGDGQDSLKDRRAAGGAGGGGTSAGGIGAGAALGGAGIPSAAVVAGGVAVAVGVGVGIYQLSKPSSP